MKRFLVLAALSAIPMVLVISCGKDDGSTSASDPEIIVIDDAMRAEAEREREAARNVDYEEYLGTVLPADEPFLDWKPSGSPVSADADSFEEVAGQVDKAEAIEKYGLTAYRRLSFRRADRPDESLDVEMLRMNKLMGGFGLYASYRDPSFEYVDKKYGNQAFIDGNRLYQWNSHFVIRAELQGTGRDAAEIKETLLAVGLELATRIREHEPPILPRYLRTFPGSEIIPNTQKYGTEPFLGLSFLRPAVTAEYALPEGLLTAFLIFHDDDKASAEAFHELLEHLKQNAVLLDEYLGVGAESVRAEVPDRGRCVFVLQQRFILGFLGIEGDAIPTELLQGFVANIDGLFWKSATSANPDESESGATQDG
jgi:hypothetical protein